MAKSGRPTTFITLTSNPAMGFTPASRARCLADAWRIIVRRACKKYGYKHIPYLCVFEATKRGEPHLHILARVKWIDQRWLSQQMRELTNAPIVDIRQVKTSKEIASYISKYVGKEPHRFETCKRYWSTRSWEVVKYEPDGVQGSWYDGWEFIDCPVDMLTRMYEGLGFAFEVVGGYHIGRSRAPPYRRFEDATI